MTDAELIERYTSEHSEASFQAIVSRYLPLVYSAALRQVRNPAMADDVAQVVFIILARKAAHLSSGTILSAWLFRTTRHVASKALRTEIRRQKREQEVLHMQTAESTDIWAQVEPHIDEALSQMGEVDRGAILLHYFENKRLREVGSALGMTEDTAQKRVSRAVEKLRKMLFQRGVVLPVVAIPGLLMTRGASAAPAYLGAKITSASLNKAALASSVYALLQESMTQALIPLAAKVAVAAVATLAIAVTAVASFWPKHAPNVVPPSGPSRHELEARAVATKLAELQSVTAPPQLPPPDVPPPAPPATVIIPDRAPTRLDAPSRGNFQPTKSSPVVTNVPFPSPAPTQAVAAANAADTTVSQYPPDFQGQYNGAGYGAAIWNIPNGGGGPRQQAPSTPTAPVMSPLQRQQPAPPSPPRSNQLKKKN